jgi:hypothetical protein
LASQGDQSPDDEKKGTCGRNPVEDDQGGITARYWLRRRDPTW